MVIEDVVNAYHNGRQILLLTERTEHIQWFCENMKDTVPNLFVLKGGFGKKQLKKIFNSNYLKLIAIIAMTIDHGTDLLYPGFPSEPTPLALHFIGRQSHG